MEAPAKFKERFWGWTTRTDALVGLTGAVVSTGFFAWLAQRWTEVTGGSWPASIFMGLGVVCVLALVGSVLLFALGYFRAPLPGPAGLIAQAPEITDQVGRQVS